MVAFGATVVVPDDATGPSSSGCADFDAADCGAGADVGRRRLDLQSQTSAAG